MSSDGKKSFGTRLIEAFSDNVLINFWLSPVYFFGLLIYLHNHVGLPILSDSIGSSAATLATFSTCFYLWTSKFFQPDLDHHTKRPGRGCFPFFPSWKKNRIIRALDFLLNPISISDDDDEDSDSSDKKDKSKKKAKKPFGVTWLWDNFWKFFAWLFTHRGVVHWPVLGVWLRIGWILLWYYLFQWAILGIFGNVIRVPYLLEWCMSFFPWNKGFGSVGFILFCLPVYLSDIFHLVGDFVESRLKGTSFRPPLSPRGAIHTLTFGAINKLKQIKQAVTK